MQVKSIHHLQRWTSLSIVLELGRSKEWRGIFGPAPGITDFYAVVDSTDVFRVKMVLLGLGYDKSPLLADRRI